MKNRHPKRERAIKMLSSKEIKAHISPFSSKAWELHKQAIKQKNG